MQELNVFERAHGVSTEDVVQALAEEFADGNLEHLEKQVAKVRRARKELDETLTRGAASA